jgi:DNA-binding protein
MGEKCSNVTIHVYKQNKQSHPQTGAVKGVQIDDHEDMVKNRRSQTSAVKDIRIDGRQSENKHQQESAVKTVEIY